jgi:sec-independent protein translocase protein TatA
MRVHCFVQWFMALLLSSVSTVVVAFIPRTSPLHTPNGLILQNNLEQMKTAKTTTTLMQPFRRQRRSVANIQLCGLFGLGAPEIAVILIAAAFLLGPQKLAELGKDAGKIAGELKEVPKEFQAGLKEGEQAAQMSKQQPAPTEPAAIDASTTVVAAEEKKD